MERRPPVIAAFLGTQALGNFIMYHLTAASIARALPGSKLIAVYRDDRPYKNFITLMNPYVATSIKAPADDGAVIPIDWFGSDGESGVPAPDIFLTPSMLDMTRCLRPAPALRIPQQMEAPLGEALGLRGLDPQRWFACVHMREPFYEHRRGMDEIRNVDPRTFLPMIRHIIEEQGGQVVRLGDPTMTPLPQMDGLIDLSRIKDNFPEQAFAMSRARYFVGSESGTTQIASAFKTPAASSNNCCEIGVWNDGDVVLAKRFVLTGGHTLGARELLEMGALTMHNMHPPVDELLDNTPEELLALAAHMFEITKDCAGWRRPAAEETPPPLENVTLPLQWQHSFEAAKLTIWDGGP